MPRPRVVPSVVLAIALSWLPAVGGDNPRAVLARVREYLTWYDRQLVTLVADEHYVQTGEAGPAGVAGRIFESEFAWIAIPELQDVLGVREVRTADGTPVSGPSRLSALLARRPADALAEVRAILAESATHNIGHVQRNINFPTFALAYLRAADRDGTRWRTARSGAGLDLTFEEKGRTTLVRSPGGDRVPARGRFTVDPATGRVVRLELRMPVPDYGRPGMEYHMEVQFADDHRLGICVPARMRERYIPEGASDALTHVLSGEATYTSYRRYEGDGRLIP